MRPIVGLLFSFGAALPLSFVSFHAVALLLINFNFTLFGLL